MDVFPLIRKMLDNHKVKANVINTIQDKKLSDDFISEHNHALDDFSCQTIITGHDLYHLDNTVYLVYLNDCENNRLIGGGHVILRRNDNIHLPAEEVIKKSLPDQYPNFLKDITINSEGRCVSEGGGLWINKNYRKMNYHIFFPLLGIVASNHLLNCDKNYVLLSPHMPLDFFQRIGYTVEKEYGNNGKIIYPDERYISTLISWNKDVIGDLDQDIIDSINYIYENVVS